MKSFRLLVLAAALILSYAVAAAAAPACTKKINSFDFVVDYSGSMMMKNAQLKQDIHVAKLFEVLGERYKDRQGGYVRILKAGFRYGDMAPMAIIELVDRDPEAKGAADRARLDAEMAADDE